MNKHFLFLPALFLSVAGPSLFANPSGGVVVEGAATINAPNASQLLINQNSQLAIINWQDFSIGLGETTTFVQPGANSTAINRVVSGNVSELYGTLNANGNVFLINPNGVFIGETGVVDLGGTFLASTLDASNEDLLNGGPTRFYGNASTGVTNFGTIESASGDVILMGGFVDQGGQIGALNGTVAIGAGGEVLLEESSQGKISVQSQSSYSGTAIETREGSSISATQVQMEAHGNPFAMGINNRGVVRAAGANRSGGRVRLKAIGSTSSLQLAQTSVIDASGEALGGSVDIEAQNITAAGNIDASSTTGRGGSVGLASASVSIAETADISADGVVAGGNIGVRGSEDVSLLGSLSARAAGGDGGAVDIEGKTILLDDSAHVGVSGGLSGGKIRIGGDFQGEDTGLIEADSVAIGSAVTLEADAAMGDAGEVILWSNKSMNFQGAISAQAAGMLGDGGLVEVSGKEFLYVEGDISVGSKSGSAGTVLFDPGNVIIGATGGPPPLTSPLNASTISVASINQTLQSGADVLVVTEDGDIIFQDLGGWSNLEGNIGTNATGPDINASIQWTNSASSFGAFAGGSITVLNNIRTSGEGSVNLLAGWTGAEADPQLLLDPQAAWDYYLAEGQFGANNGAVRIGTSNLGRSITVGSRYGDTNVAGADITVQGSSINGQSWTNTQLGFYDNGNVFAPRANLGGTFFLDLTDETNGGARILDNGAGADGQAVSGQYDPVVGIVGQNEVDVNGDGIADGVYGINSQGVLDGTAGKPRTFIPYAKNMNASQLSGNWWWQQIHEQAVLDGFVAATDAGGNRPEMGAGTEANPANINVIATGDVNVLAGTKAQEQSAQIGHGGVARSEGTGSGTSIATSSNALERGQIARRWTINGSMNDRKSTSIARLAPVYGAINVFSGVDSSAGVTIDSLTGDAQVSVGGAGDILISAEDDTDFDPNSGAQIGHAGLGQFGEFYGDIDVRAGGGVSLISGEGTRRNATIGHTSLGHAYWDPTSVEDQQIRFFATVGDFENPNLRRGELFSGNITTGFDPAADPDAATRNTSPTYAPPGNDSENRSPLTLAPNGLVTVEALEGSIVKGYHGNINVEAKNGEIVIEAGENGPNAIGARDRRFAGIGHGGSAFRFFNEGSGYNGAVTGPISGSAGRETVVFEAGLTDTGSRSVVGNRGGDLARSLTMMTITGDVLVTAGSDITLTAGEDIYDFAYIGHSLNELTDYETSSFVVGDVIVKSGGDITIQSSKSVDTTNRNATSGGFDTRANAFIGHAATDAYISMVAGDIDVEAAGDVRLTGGGYTFTGSKIGHLGFNSRSQVGGSYTKVESYTRDSTNFVVTSQLDENRASVNYANTTTGETFVRDFTSLGAGSSIGGVTTADIDVRAGGSVTLEHIQAGDQAGPERTVANLNDINQGARTRLSTVMIGHGEENTTPLGFAAEINYGDRVGDISITAGGNLDLTSSNGRGRSTKIGHYAGEFDRGGDGAGAVAGNPAVIFAGDITLDIAGDVNVDASFADEEDNPVNASQLFGGANPSERNHVTIGHGGLFENRNLVVLSDGEDVNGIAASSDIDITSGGNMSVLGGKGLQASYAQVGHGFYSSDGDDQVISDGSPAGFSGDIGINVAGNLLVEAGSNNLIRVPNSTNDEVSQSTQANYAAIGHGGYQLDAKSSGDIEIYVGNDFALRAQTFTDAPNDQPGNGGVSNPDTGFFGSLYGFAKVGHFAIENGANQQVRNADQTGDITVVVANDLEMRGGTSADADTQPLYGAFTQIGLGGPGIDGDLNGDISVLVGNDILIRGGIDANDGVDTSNELNNYSMIGHGDRIEGANDIFSEAQGQRNGDIVVAAGNNITVEDGLIGHRDLAVSTQPSTGNTIIAASRNNPFFDGAGLITASDNSVFSSGDGGQLQIILPKRSNNLIDGSTRLNEATATFEEAPADFVGLDASLGQVAGRADEVYLTPDLVWDGVNGFFPTNATSGDGGAIASVVAPGGRPNATFAPGALGSSATLYRGGNGVSGAGDYTLYYDSLEVVLPPPPIVPPGPPLPIFNFNPFLAPLYTEFANEDPDRSSIFLNGERVPFGLPLFSSLEYFPEDSEDQEGANAWWFENALDNVFGRRQLVAAEEEEDEEKLRRLERRRRAVGPAGNIYYQDLPNYNPYSSYSFFRQFR